MKLLRYAVIAVAVALTGCASTGGSHRHHHGYDLSKQQKDVWERIRKGFDMPDLDNDPKVDYWTNYYASRPKSVETMAQRSRRYIYYITKELEKRDMPSELALLPFVESAYNANALSRSKAAGLWQFIPSTGTHYNLTQDWWRDERQDTIHSTRAALDYLSYLYQFQGNDWHLALASYNWGEGAVRRARERNASQGLGTDFLSLRMPNETRNYVPKLMAIKRIIADPEKYGIRLPNIPDQPYFVEIVKDKDIDVNTIVKLAGISNEEFRLLNPANKRPVILGQHRMHILLPKKNVAQYERNLKQHKGDLSSWKGYNPTPGESLVAIAERHGISLASLKSLNGYSRSQNVAISSRTLLIPRSTGVSTQSSPSGIDTRDLNNPIAQSSQMLASNQASSTMRSPSPSIRLGETSQARLSSVNSSREASDDLIGNLVAQQQPAQTSMPTRTIPSMNDVVANVSGMGRASASARTASYSASRASVVARTVSAPMYTKRSSNGPVVHTVVAGDTLYSLARRYGTTVDGIRALNNLGKREIRKGERLRMPGSGVQS